MKDKLGKGMSRRELLKFAGALAAYTAVPGIPGCVSLPAKPLPRIDYTRGLVIKNCSVIDTVSGALMENATLRIRGEKILALSQRDDIDAPGAAVIDAGGRFVTPGFVDAHCHTTASPVFTMSPLDMFKHATMQKRHFVASIESGVTTVRDMGAFPPLLHGFMKDIDEGGLIGPRVVHCNSILNIAGSHPDIPVSEVSVFAKPASLFIGMMMTNFEDTAELRRVMDENARGASFIKLTVDNKSIFPRTGDIPCYSDEQLALIFDYAAKQGLPVACHHHRKWGFDRMMKYPIHSLEHTVCDALLSDAELDTLVKKGVSVVPTLTVAQSYLFDEAYGKIPDGFDDDLMREELAARRAYLRSDALRHCDPDLHAANMDVLRYYRHPGLEKLWENHIYLVDPAVYFGIMKYGMRNVKRMRDAGVPMGVGIDAGMPFCYFGGYYRELECMARAGLTNAEILRCATVNGARIVRMEDRIGTVAEGKLADLALFDRNPLEDITACRTPAAVMKAGKILHCEKSFPVCRLPESRN